MDEQSEPIIPIIPPGDRAVFLAGLLKRRGIHLGVSWRSEIIPLTVRIYNLLDNSDLETIGEILQALGNHSEDPVLGKNVSMHVIDELWEMFEIMAGPAVTNYRPPTESAEEIFSKAYPDVKWIDQSLSDYTLSRMMLAGINPDQPWENALPVVPARLRKVLSRFDSLRDVVIAATDNVGSFNRTRNFGQKTLRTLWALLEKLAEEGADAMHYGIPATPPSTIEELIMRVMDSLPKEDGQLLRRHYLDGVSMRQIGIEEGKSVMGIKYRINRILVPIRSRMGSKAEELLSSLIKALDESGGLVHRDLAQKLTSTNDLRRIYLAATIAGFFKVQIWRGEFLTTLKSDEIMRKIKDLKS